jgi:hypothetical protein
MNKRRRLPYEENEAQIEILQEAVDVCVEKRDYVMAKIQQSKLDALLEDRDYYNKHRGRNSANSDLKELENKQRNEEFQLKRRMSAKMERILRQSNMRLESMKRRHQDEINSLDKRYSDPRFGNLRMSSDFQALFRAENYYAKIKDFKMAHAVKEQITNRAQYKLGVEQNYADRTVQSKMDATINRQQNEMKNFHQYLENQKNMLKKETAAGLQFIHNKYSKIRFKMLGGKENDKGILEMLPADGSVSGVYDELDEGFSKIQNTLVEPMPPIGTRSPRTKQMFSSTGGSCRARSPTKPLSPRNECSSPRNPRVAKAFENSLKTSGFVSTI